MLKSERFTSRGNELGSAIQYSFLMNSWKNIRSDLRQYPYRDLHDYYDFHVHKRNKIQALVEQILDGRYQPSFPIRLRAEKSKGLARHIIVPCPEDSLVLEVVCQALIKRIVLPETKSFFSRKHGGAPSIENVDPKDTHYFWWELWPEFQRKIFGFVSENSYVVVTDVANYYDGIDFVKLRNYISGLSNIPEPILDFIFFVIEKFTWRPDYLPYSGRGLPQMDMDAPRFLAHVFLLEIDTYLQRTVGNNYVRWMDDIDFGCDSKTEAKEILRTIDEILLTNGLHLNSSKTKILTKLEAKNHFNIEENWFLNVFTKRLDRLIHSKLPYEREIKQLTERYLKFYNGNRTGSWEKVIKRYFSLATKANTQSLDYDLNIILEDIPSCRKNVCQYLKRTGWTFEREQLVKSFVLNCVDDISVFYGVRILLEWRSSFMFSYSRRMVTLAENLFEKHGTETAFINALWLQGKYASSKELSSFIQKTYLFWSRKDYLARQVVATFPRLNKKVRASVKGIIRSFGLLSAQSVLSNFEFIADKGQFKTVFPYVKQANKDGHYPLWKAFIALSLFEGTYTLTQKTYVLNELISLTKNDIISFWFKKINLS
ncbi:RNA-directed DNA polymerase [Maridesulfovibrio sp. FT414]|uniref:RNA-directed DNA polymerase n=1 Tax=Maridesulfovibrio sp. FT414 TaxID=2979469 RepID=UPI003D80710E